MNIREETFRDRITHELSILYFQSHRSLVENSVVQNANILTKWGAVNQQYAAPFSMTT